jgi:hypothetical protein
MSKRPEAFELDKSRLTDELDEFGRLLGTPTTELSERGEILPFFKAHSNLASLVGSYNPLVLPATVLKSELGLFGDVACDLVVGVRETGQFCFVEFEDASADSLFRPPRGKGTPDWSPRLEHGLSQHTPQFRSFFTHDLADYCGLLVIGRDAFLTDDLRHRLRWRSQNAIIAGKNVSVVTFDELYETLRVRVELLTTPLRRRKRTR